MHVAAPAANNIAAKANFITLSIEYCGQRTSFSLEGEGRKQFHPSLNPSPRWKQSTWRKPLLRLQRRDLNLGLTLELGQ